ncbi:MAG: YdcF family protein [Terriglobales bacterium]|jgi:uncharacterized SAM-binding protein YcdF (DUF218 family)|nr:YdcF family protein [Terriglobales bacterium]
MAGTSKTVRLALIGLAVLVIAVTAVAGFRNVGRWLVCDDRLSRADVIFVLSGGLPYRAEEAGKVFGMGYAPEVWVSRPESPADDLEKYGVHFIGEEEYDRQILMHEGVPESAIHILSDSAVDTEQEVQEAVREMRRAGKTRVIIVTSPQHTRRVKALWKRFAGDSPAVLLHAAREDPYDSSHWWRNTRDVFSVVRETLGLINVWAGLPVPPRTN